MCTKSSRLQILVLSPIEPYPPTGGWPMVVYNDVRHLAARGHRLYVLALAYDRAKQPSDLSGIADAEYFYKSKPPKSWQVLKNLGRRLPYSVERHIDQRLLARAVERTRAGKVDVVLIEDVVMGQYAELICEATPVPTFLRGHNISTTVARRFYESVRNPILRYLGYRQYVKFARYERRIFEVVAGASQISPTDVAEAEELNPQVKQLAIYAAVDLDYFRPAPFNERDPNTIVHVGSVHPITKLPALIWFYERVLPRVRQRHPRVKLELAGRVPNSVLSAADPSAVIVHGRVPDVRPYLAKGAAFVAPQFVGSGIRLKIITAMATGNAVVATPVGCEGLPVTHGKDILIADDEQSFAECVCQLIEDAELRRKIGEQARSLVERHFVWARIAEQLEAALRGAIEAHRQKRC